MWAVGSIQPTSKPTVSFTAYVYGILNTSSSTYLGIRLHKLFTHFCIWVNLIVLLKNYFDVGTGSYNSSSVACVHCLIYKSTKGSIGSSARLPLSHEKEVLSTVCHSELHSTISTVTFLLHVRLPILCYLRYLLYYETSLLSLVRRRSLLIKSLPLCPSPLNDKLLFDSDGVSVH